MNTKLVNWVEGMTVNHLHFQQMENYFIDRLRDDLTGRLTAYNYGLLPSDGDRGNSDAFDISQQLTGKVEIRLIRCNALTSGGYRISYNPPHGECLLYTHSFDADSKSPASDKDILWDVILSVEPYRRVPTGIPDEEETPPRHPDCTEHYSLSVVLKDTLNLKQMGLHHLVIGRIRQRGERYEVDNSHIPPCTSMNSHAELLIYFEKFNKYLSDIERASMSIIAKIRNRTNNTSLANQVFRLCQEIIRHISSIYFKFRNTGKYSAPIYIVDYCSTLAHTCFAALNFNSTADKEEMLKYFYEWIGVTPGTFEEQLAETLGILYDHENIRVIMFQAESFLATLSELLIKLSTLEYIGQHKENIVVAERWGQSQQTKTDRGGGWNILG